MSPRIRRICRRALSFPGLRGFNILYISYLPLFGRFAEEVSANPSYFCCPVRTPRVRRPVCGHSGEPFRSVDSDCFYGSSRFLSGLPEFGFPGFGFRALFRAFVTVSGASGHSCGPYFPGLRPCAFGRALFWRPVPAFPLRAPGSPGLVLCLRTLALRPSTAPDLFRPLLPPGPFGAFRLLFSGPLRRHGLRISAGRLRRFPVFMLFRCGILRDPFVGPVIRFETRMSGSLRILS